MKPINSFSLAFLLLTSCGKDSGPGSSSPRRASAEAQLSKGAYRATLRPLNNHLSGFLPSGIAEISIDGDSVRVRTLLDDDARVVHRQSIQVGGRCPDAEDDKNGDGVVDIQEAYRASGSVIILLDNDLNSDHDRRSFFPMGGGFTYQRSASLSKLESEARERANQNLTLGGRVVLIHGVAARTPMPPTVATVDGETAQASTPIACGVLKREE